MEPLLASIDESVISGNDFGYSPLLPRQIRLLHLSRPDNIHEPGLISCTFSSVLLDENIPSFIALSYCWGTADPTHAILLNNSEFLIRKNLHAFLEQCQYTQDTEFRPLWIDAVCINQENIKERESQVNLMGDLYVKASLVKVWLGEGEQNCHLAFKLIDIMNTWFNSNEPLDQDKLLLDSFTKPNSPAWAAIGQLVRLPWFSRVWVIQEIVFAKSAVILWGSERISWESLVRFVEGVTLHRLQAFQDDPETYDQIEWGWNTVSASHQAKVRIAKGINIPMSTIMMCWKNLATNPKDHIYGKLGFATNRKEFDVQPDYSSNLDTSDLYASFSAQIIMFEKSLDLITSAGIGYARSLPKLPSWAPDYQHQGYDNRDYRNFKAAGATEAKVSFGENKELTVSGHMIDVVTEVSSVWGQYFEPLEAWKWYEAIEKQFLRPGINDKEFRRTLCADRPRIQDNDNDVDRIEAYFQAFRTSWKMLYDRSVVVEGEDRQGEKERQEKYIVFTTAFNVALKNRRMCTMKNGRLGTVPPGSKVGDVVFLGFGARCPLLLRKSEGVINYLWGNRYYFVGNCWVHGMMNGEALGMGFREEQVVLV